MPKWNPFRRAKITLTDEQIVDIVRRRMLPRTKIKPNETWVMDKDLPMLLASGALDWDGADVKCQLVDEYTEPVIHPDCDAIIAKGCIERQDGRAIFDLDTRDLVWRKSETSKNVTVHGIALYLQDRQIAVLGLQTPMNMSNDDTLTISIAASGVFEVS